MTLEQQFTEEIARTVDPNTFENRLQNLSYFINEITKVLKVHVPAEHVKQWLLDNHFDHKFSKILLKLTRDRYQVHFLLENFKRSEQHNQESEQHQSTPNYQTHQEPEQGQIELNSHHLNPEYRFTNFIVGESNEIAYYAGKNVTENPGGSHYNPLFIYGGVGLGKTHLLHAIGHELLETNPRVRIVNLTTEEFLNAFYEAMTAKKMPQLIDRFRKNCDILLMDDIQFLAKRKGVQEHFFHIFNHLRDAQKQIVITSDRYPNEIPDIEERLRSRFEWGLIVDVLPPKFATRVAIVREKCRRFNFPLDDELINFLSENLRSNIREIEGVLRSLNAISTAKRRPIDIEMTREYLQKVLKLTEKVITIDKIQKTVAKFYDLTVEEMVSKKRQRTITVPRQISMYLAKKMTTETLDDIGAAFDRDHSTVVNSIKKVEQLLQKDIKYQRDIKVLNRTLTN